MNVGAFARSSIRIASFAIKTCGVAIPTGTRSAPSTDQQQSQDSFASSAMIRQTNSGYFLPSPILRPAGSKSTTKFILVTGGVCSSLGKGMTTSAIGALLKANGVRVSAIKIDPYINVDAGLMSPFEHGEVYVLNDGGEVDLDLGNYERWFDVSLSREHNVTTGKVYQQLIKKERAGEFLGKTITVVPYFTNFVTEHILRVAEQPVDASGLPPQVCLIELGGTVGDMESAPFVEALRTLRFTMPADDFVLIHCTYLPVLGGAQKTKPTQHGWRTLLSLGLTADFLVCRSEVPLEASAKSKVSQQCGIKEQYIIGAHNVRSLYDLPLLFSEQNLIDKIARKLRLDTIQIAPPPLTFPSLDDFRRFSATLQNVTKRVKIAFVGKYVVGGSDAYFSVMQTFEHCCVSLGVAIDFLWMDSEALEASETVVSAKEALRSCDGIFVPGGFGTRGINGKISAAELARTADIPYFGVCLGMQIALIEMARNVLGWKDANSEEFDAKSSRHILKFMLEIDRATMGANMRLGGREVHILEQDSILSTIYGGSKRVQERHRHRYEFNMDFIEEFRTKAGVRFVGSSEPTLCAETRIEAIELPRSAHRFFLAVQYHPEFRSTTLDASPPFLAFVAAAAGISREWPQGNSRQL